MSQELIKFNWHQVYHQEQIKEVTHQDKDHFKILGFYKK